VRVCQVFGKDVAGAELVFERVVEWSQHTDNTVHYVTDSRLPVSSHDWVGLYKVRTPSPLLVCDFLVMNYRHRLSSVACILLLVVAQHRVTPCVVSFHTTSDRQLVLLTAARVLAVGDTRHAAVSQ